MQEREGWTLANKLALAGVIVAVIGVITGTQISSKSGGGGQHETSSGSSNTPSAGSTPPHAPTSRAKPAFLSSLTPSAGDQPTPGDIQLAGADFRHSIFYEDIAGGDVSSAPACENVPSEFDCRATSYDLGGRYRRFTASFGLTQGGNPAFNAEGRWEISVDDQVIKQGVAPANKAPTPIDVPLGSGRVLVLRAAVHEAVGDTSTVAWGDARIH